MKFRKYFNFINLTTIVIAFLIFSSYLIIQQKEMEKSEYDQKINKVSQLISITNTYNLYNMDTEAIRKNLETFYLDKDIIRIELSNQDLGTKITLDTKEKIGELKIKTIPVYYKDQKLGDIKLTFTDYYYDKKIEQLRNSILYLFIMVVTFSVLISSKIMKHISEPIMKFISNVEMVSKGDFTVKMEPSKIEEINNLGKKFNKFIEILSGVLKEIRDGAIFISEATSEISDANQNLANETSRQANRVEETTEAIDEISDVIIENARLTKEAKKITKKTEKDTIEIEKNSKKLNMAMEGIKESSDQIYKIIDLIEEISFQTNLLSLNAAVEASKAGEYGKGFAVIAAEIRDLAQKSKNSSKKIKDLIDENSLKIKEGNQSVDATINNIKNISEEVKSINDFMKTIADGAVEQEHGAQRLEESIGMINDGIQNNAGIAEENSSASHELYEKSKNFLLLIKRFTFDDSKEQ
ncbi:MAG: methyl-accepting chemotaxis protein [Fusobacteriota bacterium]